MGEGCIVLITYVLNTKGVYVTVIFSPDSYKFHIHVTLI